MSPTPTGRLRGSGEQLQVHLTREFRAPVADVWASLTESDRTAQWFASWSGEAAPGSTVRMRMVHEEGEPESEVQILACEPPHHLEVLAADDAGRWHLEARLQEHDGVTTLTFVHHLERAADVVIAGTGWEYYLDMLVASRDGGPRPDFADYYPGMADYYSGLSA